MILARGGPLHKSKEIWLTYARVTSLACGGLLFKWQQNSQLMLLKGQSNSCYWRRASFALPQNIVLPCSILPKIYFAPQN
jgi:hypothetical protein